ncbi:MAG: DUF1810 domain-containing protein [Muribaculaceae bacterium]|nr:DUF1810 domain-containing protein [Muribaculaceae bacterium]MDE5595681.1 DUF1810 domain-containing protein [Muribaculaceae bacterium]
MNSDRFNLARFFEGQYLIYPIALKELQTGVKRTHWMWFIFPQVKGLGKSYNSMFYGLSGIDEAKEYLAEPTLNNRLREITETVLNLQSDSILKVFGKIDSMKLQSSMTIFDLASPDDIFAKVLDKWYDGQRDSSTLKILQNS